jgi:hypothetical protein
VSGGTIHLDAIVSRDFSNAAPSTWGGIKSLYE